MWNYVGIIKYINILPKVTYYCIKYSNEFNIWPLQIYKIMHFMVCLFYVYATRHHHLLLQNLTLYPSLTKKTRFKQSVLGLFCNFFLVRISNVVVLEKFSSSIFICFKKLHYHQTIIFVFWFLIITEYATFH